MRVKLIVGMILIGLVAVLIACGGKYADAEKVFTEFADAMDVYLQDLEEAKDADATAKAINEFADVMEGLAPRMQKISAKYPELKDPENTPEKLKPIKERSDKTAMKMAGTFMKAMQHMKNPEVNAAFTRLGKVMSSMGK